MTHVLKDLIPENFSDWRMDVLKLPGSLTVTARRTGVTIMLVEVDGWWTVSKMHKGQRLGCKQVKRLPKAVADTIELRRRQQMDGITRYMAGRP